MAGLLSKASNSSRSCRRNMAGPRMKQPLLSQPLSRADCSGIVPGESAAVCRRGGRYLRPPLVDISASLPCPAVRPWPAGRPWALVAARPGGRQRRGPEPGLAHARPAAAQAADAAPRGAPAARRGTPERVVRAAAYEALAVARHARSAAVAGPDAASAAVPRAPPAVAAYAAVRASAAARGA